MNAVLESSAPTQQPTNGHTAPDSGTHQDQHQQPAPARPKSKHAGIQQRNQAASLQRFAYDAAMSLRTACSDSDSGKLLVDVKTAASVHKLIQAWDTAANRLRVLRGRGLPLAERRRPRSSVPDEPLVKP